jgi:hypothetical protein
MKFYTPKRYRGKLHKHYVVSFQLEGFGPKKFRAMVMTCDAIHPEQVLKEYATMQVYNFKIEETKQ